VPVVRTAHQQESCKEGAGSTKGSARSPPAALTVPRVHAFAVVQFVSDNASAVYEVPELTDRSAEGFPRPLLIDTFHSLPWQGREAAAA
jgi:hypothetical protein